MKGIGKKKKKNTKSGLTKKLKRGGETKNILFRFLMPERRLQVFLRLQLNNETLNDQVKECFAQPVQRKKSMLDSLKKREGGLKIFLGDFK